MVDYSKWQNIEVSDDEDDGLFGVHTPSCFRQTRLERMEKHKKEIEQFEKKKADHNKKMSEVKQKLSEARAHVTAIEEQLEQLEKESENFTRMEKELKEKEVKAPWNVDTISKPGFSKTVINTAPPTPTKEEKNDEKQKFIEEHEEEVRHFGMLRKYDESRAYLRAHDYLFCEATADYLLSWCVSLDLLNQDKDLLEHVAHQHFCMRHILGGAERLNLDPRVYADAFLAKVTPLKFLACFQEHLPHFKEVIARVGAEYEKHIEQQMRLGPGGLDPVEVFDSLPIGLRLSFQTQNHFLLRQAIAGMHVAEMMYHMDRCVDSGLWIPNANSFEDLF